MKKLLMILSVAMLMVACGNASEGKDCSKKDCKKECSAEDKEACKKKCKAEGKECAHKGDKCEKDCKKACCASKKEANAQLEIGTDNPSTEIMVKDISGTESTLGSLAKENGLAIIFSCNTCPFVVGREGKSEGWENRYNGIEELASKNNVGFVLVNSNEAKRDRDDSFEEMVKHASEAGYNNIKYVVDENHVIADAYGAKTTPHVFLFNKENKLVYKGAIDDNVDSKDEVKETYLVDAINNLVEGKEITPAETRNMGCSIKRIKADH